MKRLKLNPYKANILDSPEEPVEIDQVDFWNFYLNTLRVKGLNITDTDIDFYIRTILYTGTDKDFAKENNYSAQYVHTMRKRLIACGLLVKVGRGHYDLHSSIRNMKNLISSGRIDILQFTFPFKVVGHEK